MTDLKKPVERRAVAAHRAYRKGDSEAYGRAMAAHRGTLSHSKKRWFRKGDGETFGAAMAELRSNDNAAKKSARVSRTRRKGQGAQGAADMITAADIELVRDAAVMLDEEALHLRMAHCVPPAHTDWDDDLGAKDSHDEMKALVDQLHDLADRLAAFLEAQFRADRAMCEALNSADGVYRP